MNESKHYKMYKAGKLWLTATITVLAFTGMTTVAKADDQGATAQNTQQAVAVSQPAVVSETSATPAPADSTAQSAAAAASGAADVNAQAATSEKNSSSQVESQLDNNVLSDAGAFHIFANDVTIDADVNGNIATHHYVRGIEFGTRNDSHNYKLSDGQGNSYDDIYYIESFDKMGGNAFRNSSNYVVFGDGASKNISFEGSQVYAPDNIRLDHLNKDAVHYGQLIDFTKAFQALRDRADYFAKQLQTAGVVTNFTDNNRYIDISGVDAGIKTIYVDVPVAYLKDQTFTIKGLSSSEDGPVVIINVRMDDPAATKYEIGTQIKMIYDDGQQVSPSEGHAKPNHVVWNFGNPEATLDVNSGYFMGSVLAPKATLKAGVNMDGNLVAKQVTISGGESHRWDLRGGEFIQFNPKSDTNQPGDNGGSNDSGNNDGSDDSGNNDNTGNKDDSGNKDNSSNPGNPTNSNNDKPDVSNPDNHPEIITPRVPMEIAGVNNHQSSTPSTSSHVEKTTVVTPHTSAKAASATQLTPVNGQWEQEQTAVTATPAVQSAGQQEGQGHGLPQTGSSRSVLTLILGLITGSLSLLGLRKRRF